jgi:hypothetical protein
VEFGHQKRGRVFEVGTGAGCTDAAFNAVAAAVGVEAPVKSLEVQYEPPFKEGALPIVTVEIEVAIDGGTYRGCARTRDLLLSAVGAYLDALCRVEKDQRGYPGAVPY